jgi:hypothetical protein
VPAAAAVAFFKKSRRLHHGRPVDGLVMTCLPIDFFSRPGAPRSDCLWCRQASLV